MTSMPNEQKIRQISKLTIQDASEIMGVTPRFLQMALQQDKFPFGVGVRMGKWSYYINANRFYEYMRLEPQKQEEQTL